MASLKLVRLQDIGRDAASLPGLPLREFANYTLSMKTAASTTDIDLAASSLRKAESTWRFLRDYLAKGVNPHVDHYPSLERAELNRVKHEVLEKQREAAAEQIEKDNEEQLAGDNDEELPKAGSPEIQEQSEDAESAKADGSDISTATDDNHAVQGDLPTETKFNADGSTPIPEEAISKWTEGQWSFFGNLESPWRTMKKCNACKKCAGTPKGSTKVALSPGKGIVIIDIRQGKVIDAP